MVELERRSVGCALVVLRVNERGGDNWLTRCKGSPCLLSALSVAMAIRLQTEVLRQTAPAEGA